MRARTTVGAALAALTLFPASAAAQATVDVPKRCYAEGDKIDVRGTGFTPNGPVTLALSRGAEELESTADPRADASGVVDGDYGVKDETGWFTGAQTRFEMTLRLEDQTDPALTDFDTFIFSRWNVGITTAGGVLHPKRPATIQAVGYTQAIGKRLYAHWMRNGKRVHTRRLGVIEGPCGDRRARLARGFPFRPVRPGSYEVRFSPSRTNTSKGAIRHAASRVVRRIP